MNDKIATAIKVARRAVRRLVLATGWFVALAFGFMVTPQFAPVPTAWAETAAAAIRGLSAITDLPEMIKSSNGALYAFGQIFPGEDTTINRMAITEKDSCVRYTADQNAIKTGPGIVTRIIYDTVAATTDDFVLYDALTATGTIIFSATNMPATSATGPIVVPLYWAFSTGASLDVTLTAGSSVSVCTL